MPTVSTMDGKATYFLLLRLPEMSGRLYKYAIALAIISVSRFNHYFQDKKLYILLSI